MTFAHLKITSHYEMNGSNIRLNELVEKAVQYGYGSLALTDTKMHGAVQFYKLCKAKNIKPIFGLKILLEGLKLDYTNEFTLYAKTYKGYQNLLQLASLSSLNHSIKLSEMKLLKKDIIGVLNTEQSELISYYQNNNKNDINEFYTMLESSLDTCYFSLVNNELDLEISKKLDPVYLPNVVYLEENDHVIYQTLSSIFGKENDTVITQNDGTHFLKKDEVLSRCDFQEALDNTMKIVECCSVDLEFNQTYLPKYKLDKDVSSKDYLHALVYKGLDKRLRHKRVDKKQYLERLKYELNVIDQMGYNDYFLIVWDFVKFAKQKGYLVGPGRGSAAASLVSYCLGITNIDSLEYNLVFERFLNPERITLPDIDMDLPDDKRDEIIKYVRDFYGMNKVASICTFGTFLKKSAIRDTARVLKVEGVLLENIVKETEKYNNISEMMSESKLINTMMDQQQKIVELLEISSRIEGLYRHVSTHAAGIIVSEERLVNYTPLQSGLLDMMQTQYEAKDLESLGLLKIDFLGLRNLTSIDKIQTMINENEKKKVNVYNIPLNDKKTFDLLKKVDTTGIFQLESKGMRSLIGQMQIDSFDDIYTILALFRPGPMESIPSYIKRRFKEEEITYPDPLLEPILKPTNGIIIYQEQIIQIANTFAGYSLGEADLLRRAVSKKQQDVLKKERIHFLEKAKELGRDEKTSNEIYDYIVKFANYGFNKAHSVAYAMVSYWLAYLKANYPKYFISVLTSSVIGSESQMREYIFEANKLGVKILKPSVNYSRYQFVPEDNNLRYPLLGIKNVGRNTVRDLLSVREEGPFKSYIDFVSRTQGVLNKRVIESLILAGALDEFKYSRQAMVKQYEEVVNFSLYGGFIDKNEFVIKQIDEYEFDYLEEKERQIIGFNLFINPINQYDDYIKKYKLLKVSDITNKHINKELRIVALLSSIRQITTKNGKEMAFITIADEITRMSGVLFNLDYQKFRNELKKGKVYLLKGKVDQRNGELQFVVNNLKEL